MILKQILIALIISTSIMNAADTSSESDSDASDSEVLTLYGTIDGANIERRATILKHFIEPTKKESRTHETFQALFDKNACAKNIPWIIATNITLNSHPTALVADHFDLTEMLKEKAVHEIYDFSSEEAADQTVHEKIRSLVHKKSITPPVRANLHIIYYAVKHNMGFKAHYTTASHFRFRNLKDGTITSISDLSCTLAIALCNNYSQLVPLINCLHHSSDNYDKNQRLPFWKNTLFSLPDAQQQQLLKQYNDCFEWDLFITDPDLEVKNCEEIL